MVNEENRGQNSNLFKAVLICLVVVLVFTEFVPTDFTFRGDAEFHFQKAKGNSEFRADAQERYAPLFHTISRPIIYNRDSFKYVTLVLLAILTPMALFLIKKNWQTVLIYFLGSHYFWYMFKTASQTTANLLFLGLFLTRNIYIRLLLVILSIGAHSHGFPLTVITLIILLIYENRELILAKFKYILPACSTVFGNARPNEILDTHVAGNPEFGLRIGVIANLFGKLLPFPIMWLAIKQVWKERRWDVLILSIIGFLGIIFVSERTMYIIPLLLIPYAGAYVASATKRFRWLFYFLSFSYGSYQIMTWIMEKVGC